MSIIKHILYLFLSVFTFSMAYAQEKIDVPEARYQELSQAKDKISSLEQAVKDKKIKQTQLQSKLDTLSKSDLKTLKNQIKALEDEIKTLEKSQKDPATIQGEVRVLENQVTNLTQQKNGLATRDFGSEQKKLQEENTEITNQQKDYADKQAKLEANKPAIDSLNREIQALTQAINKIKPADPKAMQEMIASQQNEIKQARTDSLAAVNEVSVQEQNITTLKNKQSELQGLETEKQGIRNNIKTAFELSLPQLINGQTYDLTKVQRLIKHCDDPLIADLNLGTWKTKLQAYEQQSKITPYSIAMQRSQERLNNPYDATENKKNINELSAMLNKPITATQKAEVNRNIELLKDYCDLSALVHIVMSNSDAYLATNPEEVSKEMNILLKQRPVLIAYPFLFSEINQRIRNPNYKYRVRDVKCN